jgi:hypothetical protein
MESQRRNGRGHGRITVLALMVVASLAGGVVSSYVTAYAAIRPSKIASVPDDSDTSKIQPSEMDPFTEPSVPVDGDIWIERSGVSPTRSLIFKIYESGAWRTLASAGY